MNLPDKQFLELNKKGFLKSQAVKSSQRKFNLEDAMRLNKHKTKVRKQVLLTHSENLRLEYLTKLFSLSNSVIFGFCVNEFYDSVTKVIQSPKLNLGELALHIINEVTKPEVKNGNI